MFDIRQLDVWPWLPLALFSALLALWYVQDVIAAVRMPRLDPHPDLPDTGPLVTVIIPARNEAARIGACLEGLARQSYRTFEVIVVDDDSADETVDVVRRFATRLPALTILSSKGLPHDWAGKCWACWQGANRARGEWLLFLDADVEPQSELLAALVERATAGRDMITLVPHIHLTSFAERLVLPPFIGLISAIYPFDRVNDPSSPLAFAIGQCIMVRRDVYTAVDGHRAVRGSVLEDMDLARIVKQSGFMLDAAIAPDLLEVRMYNGWETLIEGLKKNAVAGYRSGGVRSGLMGLRLGLMAVMPWNMLIAGQALPLLGGDPALAQALTLAGAVLVIIGALCWGVVVHYRFRIAPLWGILYGLGTAVYFALAAQALHQIRSGKGVEWKGRVFTR
ncbi:MAG: glycosyltransferase family 2 protein [Roseiflexaceae bacterium]|nr:glycosyltransferase [Roseiflexus sp.]MDW8146632.1 glycosyltransferase family 2 protein [Roseiflexaceae bacterium]MDW8232906.1 glycosyltransferase family 2 protein [Roseiflexaceae bacterium]